MIYPFVNIETALWSVTSFCQSGQKTISRPSTERSCLDWIRHEFSKFWTFCFWLNIWKKAMTYSLQLI